MTAPLILVEASPRAVDTGAIVLVHLAGGGGTLPYPDPTWRAGIAGLPRVVAQLEFDGQDLGTGSVPQALQLRWAPATLAAVAELAALHWIDADIVVRIGPEGALPPVMTAGKVLGVTIEDGALMIALSDPAGDLRKPLLTDRFAGTGGIEGPTEWEGRIKPRGWGRIFNLEGEAIDPANNVYCFADPARPWAGIDAIRDKGAAAASIAQLGWQGSIAATFAALQAAEAPPGGGVACPSIACVKWWTQPAGALCIDARGEVGASYVETAAQVAARIVAARSTVPFADGTVAAAALARPAPIGCYAADENMTAATAIDTLLGDVSLLWLLEGDAIVIRAWEWGASVVAAQSLDVSRSASFRPVGRRRLGYRRNQHKMTRDAIAGIVLASDVIFEDGTTGEYMKPAAPGATPGAPAGTTIGGVLGEDGNYIGGAPVEDVLADQATALTSTTLVAVKTELARQQLLHALSPGADGASVDTLIRRETSARSALAEFVQTVVARVGSVEATATLLLEAFAADDEDENPRAGFLLAADVLGRIVGLKGLVEEGAPSTLDFFADVIRFLSPDTGLPMLTYDAETGTLRTNKVVVDEVEAGAVTGTGLAQGAHGADGAFWRNTALSVSDAAQWTEIAHVGLTPRFGRPVEARFSAFMRCSDASRAAAFIRVVRDDGVVIWGGYSADDRLLFDQDGMMMTFQCLDGSVQARPTRWGVELRRESGETRTIRITKRYFRVDETSRSAFDQWSVEAAEGEGPATGSGGGGGPVSGDTYDPNFISPQYIPDQ